MAKQNDHNKTILSNAMDEGFNPADRKKQKYIDLHLQQNS
ncbi:uncharacterized protein FPRO_04644 [Fusarium proliferatum ET1]|uniref:Uncharacterized protein n=1 Tax=Fusarium proliferatum (strain ET1) TaxID=1227346 RepID=A0A1L7VGL0_FUSPR|nr:uncharacterized protein FPRO_04644 [Fusarium proliferatum ET1]CZR39747.1 uncharacterized protein FPRO_04644 [Fusarium proliferatum ET1]